MKGIVNEAIKIAQQDDTWKAFDFLESHGEAVDVAEHYSKILWSVYSDQKNVPMMVLFGRAGIRYCLSQASILEETDAQTAEKLKGIAKSIAFNVGANTWPGWEDEGIVITTSDLALGMDAARLNLRLAQELKRDGDALANAYWLLGVHHLAADNDQQALESFNTSAQKAAEAKNEDAQRMAEGYAAIVRLRSESQQDRGQKEFDASVARLKEIDTDEAKFFADQLQSVRNIFVK